MTQQEIKKLISFIAKDTIDSPDGSRFYAVDPEGFLIFLVSVLEDKNA